VTIKRPMWRRYLRFLGSDPAADVQDELSFHEEMRVEDLVRRGLSAAEAREQARSEFGDVAAIRAELEVTARRRVERRRRARAWESVRQDLRFAVRSLRGSAGFTAVAVLTLAVGIGAGTAMFGVLHGILLSDLPVRAQEEVVVLWTASASGATDHLPVMHRELEAFAAGSRSLASVAGVAYHGALEQVVREGGRALTVGATWVTGDFFPLLGVVPVHGRTLVPSDDVPGADPVMVVSHGFWQRHFGGALTAVGRTIEWNGRPHTVVGVAPRGFEFPRGAEAWIPALSAFPATLEPDASPQDVMVFDLVGRLARGSDAGAAAEEYDAFLRAGDLERPAALRGMKAVVTPLAEVITGDARPTLWAAAAAVLLLLLIACVNVANLLLIRGSARTQELAIRSALGAGRGRLIRQLLTESSVLALLGGALGVLLALGAVHLLVALAPPELPRRDMVGIDGRVLAFAVAITFAAALLAGLLPAVLSAAGNVGTWLRGGHRTASASRGARTLRHGLVVGQIAVAIVVVASAGLLVRSLVALQGVDLGFNQDRLLVFQASLPYELQTDRPAQVALQEEMVSRVEAIPEVASAAALPRPPFSAQGGWSAMYTGEGQSQDDQGTNPWVSFEVVGPGYFRTLEIPVYAGRPFDARDREGATPVAIVSEAVARHTWPGEEAVGRRIKLGPPEGPGAWQAVVGVVGETRYRDLADPQPSLYLPTRQFGGPVPMSLAIRTRGEPAAITPRVREALRDVHPELMVVGGGPMHQLLAAPLARPRFSAFLLAAFAVITLLLAAVGLYGAMATTVRQRGREIGIRLALGATGEEVRRLVLGQGLRLAVAGCAIGIVGALMGTRALRSLLFGVGPTDAPTFVAITALVLVAALLASAIPARRASRVAPVQALRGE
jgi:putative ABC transport system permease protein